MVASNAYQGGLQGNQEPLVIGAREWESSPRAADHLEAFFAGTISALALYDGALDGPAIAALGPAGTVLVQAPGPGTGVRPATPGVPSRRRHRRRKAVGPARSSRWWSSSGRRSP